MTGYVSSEAHCTFRQPACDDDELAVATRGAFLSAVRVEFSDEVTRCLACVSMALDRGGSRVRAGNPRAARRAAPVVRILGVPLGFPTWATLLLLATSACATSSGNGFPVGSAEPDRALYELGLEALEERRWLRAREYFVTVVDNYPQSGVRPDAMLGIGDSYYGEGTVETYLRAIDEFERFLSFYPLHPRADYAQYKLGMAHYNQMRRAERDQTETQAAIEALEIFVERYPNSELMDEGRVKLREALDRYSQSEFLVGRFYYRFKMWGGAIERFKGILDNDPGFTNRDAVYFHLAESLFTTDRKVEALPYFERLVEEFEESEYLEATRARITELKEP